MTIAGEKVPAFSAISLNLPMATGDQTAAIVAQSRSQYASSRDFVERYVGERYLGANQSPAQPQKAVQPKPKPTVPAQPTQARKPASEPPKTPLEATKTIAHTLLSGVLTREETDQAEAKPKRKRTRRRKRKSASQIPDPAAQPADRQTGDHHIIHLQ